MRNSRASYRGGADETLDLSFDDSGNIMDADRAGGTEVTYEHDGWNRFESTTFGTDLRSEYEYDGLNWS